MKLTKKSIIFSNGDVAYIGIINHLAKKKLSDANLRRLLHYHGCPRCVQNEIISEVHKKTS